MVKLAKGAKKQQGLKKKPPPPKEVEDEESSEEDSNEEETPPPKVVAKKSPKGLTAKNGKVAKKQESDDSEDESEEESQPPPKKGKATPAKVTPKKAAPVKAEESDDEDDDEDDDDEESEEETPPPKKATPAKAPTKATPAKAAPTPAKKVEEDDDDDDEDDDEDESEEEVPPPKKATPAKPLAKTTPAKAAPTPAKKVEEDDDDEEDDEDDDDEDDESEEEMDTTPAPVTKTKKAGMVKAKEESEEEDDEEDDDDEEEDDDDDDEEEEAAAVTPGKRKAESKKDTPPAKKTKSDNEGAFCLFVGNLNLDKDFDEIKDALSKFFTKKNLQVQSVRLGASKKFGYVDFVSEEDLQKALELNGKKFMGQELKLDRARSKENSKEGRKERDARTLFVKNLPFSATQDDLKELFDQAVDIRIPLDNSGSGRGIAYVEFKTEAIAEKMLEEAQGADVQGRCIVVDFTGEKSQQKGGRAAPGAAGKTLVVNNLAYSVTEETLQSTFEKAVSIKVPQNNGRSKGFAFLDFETAEDAREAFDTMNNTEIEGRTVRLEFKQNSGSKFDGGRGNSGPTKTLFVRGLSEDTTDHTLRDSFEGAVAARIVTDRETGSSKGFGFVDFGNEEDCKAAKEAMEDCEIDGHKVTLDYARPKGDGGQRGGRGGFGGRGGGFGGRGGRGGFGGRGGGFRGGRGGGRGGFGGGRGGGFGAKPQGKKIKFDE